MQLQASPAFAAKPSYILKMWCIFWLQVAYNTCIRASPGHALRRRFSLFRSGTPVEPFS